jgi:hypothetical protein
MSNGRDLMVLASKDSQKPRGTFFVVLAAIEHDSCESFAGFTGLTVLKIQDPVLCARLGVPGLFRDSRGK